MLNRVQILKALNKNLPLKYVRKDNDGGEFLHISSLCVGHRHNETKSTPLAPNNICLSDIFPSSLSKIFIASLSFAGEHTCRFLSGKSSEGQRGKFSLRNFSRQENWIDIGRSQGFLASQFGTI